MSSKVIFCPTNSSKPKDIQYPITEDKENQQINIWEVGTNALKTGKQLID